MWLGNKPGTSLARQWISSICEMEVGRRKLSGVVGEEDGLSQSREITWLNVDPPYQRPQKEKKSLVQHLTLLIIIMIVSRPSLADQTRYPIVSFNCYSFSPYTKYLETSTKTGEDLALIRVIATCSTLGIFQIIFTE